MCAPVHSCVPKLFITDLEDLLIEGPREESKRQLSLDIPRRGSEHLSPRSTKKWSDYNLRLQSQKKQYNNRSNFL